MIFILFNLCAAYSNIHKYISSEVVTHQERTSLIALNNKMTIIVFLPDYEPAVCYGPHRVKQLTSHTDHKPRN